MRLEEYCLRRASPGGDASPHSRVLNRLSSFFHGESSHPSARMRSSHSRQKSNWMLHHPLSTPNGSSQSGLRSPTSTRSLIDPSASPASSAGSISPEAVGPFQMHTNPPSIAYVRPQSFSSEARAERHLARALSHPRRRRSWEGSRPQRRKWTCLPGIGDPKQRKFAIGSLVSGTILGIMLSTYLALAISKTISGRVWHVLIIMFILVTSILFFHNLIRLFMLALGSRKQQSRRYGVPRTLDEEGFAHPQKPIRVILARDEELGLHEHDQEGRSSSSIAPPPPAYGLWRCSVRADPNLIHWQKTDEPALQNETRTLLMASHPGIRPPSYA